MEPSERGPADLIADLASLGKLFEEHRSRLLDMLRRRVHGSLAARFDPEDLLGEAFLEARRRWTKHKAEPVRSPYAWLYRIVLDCLSRAWRDATRQRRDIRGELPLPDASSVQLGLGLVGSGTSPSLQAQRAEMQEKMRQTMARLKEADRMILWLRHYDVLTFAEMGQVLEISENAATVRYVRALRRLKELWQELDYGRESSS